MAFRVFMWGHTRLKTLVFKRSLVDQGKIKNQISLSMYFPSWKLYKSVGHKHLNWSINLTRTKCLKMHLVFGVWIGNSLIPTNTFEYKEAKPTTFIASNKFSSSTCVFLRGNQPNSEQKSSEAKIEGKTFMTMCVFISPNTGEASYPRIKLNAKLKM